MGMRAMKLSASVKRTLIEAAGEPPVREASGEDDILVLVIGQGQALVGRPRAQGRAPSVRAVRRWIEAAVDGFASEGAQPAVTGLGAGEAALLDEAGFGEGMPDKPGALERSRIEYELLLRESLTLDEAAGELGVTTSRLRQRLSPKVRSIYGFKVGREWRIPRFQFQQRGRLVRNIEKVLSRVRPDAHPLAVKLWFVTPHIDLVVGDDEQPAAPLAWLATGRPAEAVATLAEEI